MISYLILFDETKVITNSHQLSSNYSAYSEVVKIQKSQFADGEYNIVQQSETRDHAGDNTSLRFFNTFHFICGM